jgi:hypothetical protein
MCAITSLHLQLILLISFFILVRRRELLIQMLDEHCAEQKLGKVHDQEKKFVESEYDFVYLPIDFRSLSLSLSLKLLRYINIREVFNKRIFLVHENEESSIIN